MKFFDVCLSYSLEDSGYLGINNPIHLFVLHYVFTPRINYALTEFKLASNLRPVRTEHKKERKKEKERKGTLFKCLVVLALEH